jgi:hypothetical protein
MAEIEIGLFMIIRAGIYVKSTMQPTQQVFHRYHRQEDPTT